MNTETESHRFLRQYYLIRYTALVERITEKLNLTEETKEAVIQALVNVQWIDNNLDEIQSLPVS
jgi:hypothetical protein